MQSDDEKKICPKMSTAKIRLERRGNLKRWNLPTPTQKSQQLPATIENLWCRKNDEFLLGLRWPIFRGVIRFASGKV